MEVLKEVSFDLAYVCQIIAALESECLMSKWQQNNNRFSSCRASARRIGVSLERLLIDKKPFRNCARPSVSFPSLDPLHISCDGVKLTLPM